MQLLLLVIQMKQTERLIFILFLDFMDIYYCIN